MSEYPKPEKKPKAKKKPIRKVSFKLIEKENQKRDAYFDIAQKRPPFCQGCGSREYEHSHRITQGRWQYKANEDNIDYYCRGCHRLYESGRVWFLDNGQEVMDWLKQTDTQYYMKKAFQMRDRLIEDDDVNISDLPYWVLQTLKDIESL